MNIILYNKKNTSYTSKPRETDESTKNAELFLFSKGFHFENINRAMSTSGGSGIFYIPQSDLVLEEITPKRFYGLEVIVNAYQLFAYQKNLKTVIGDFNLLENGGQMFRYCTNLTYFDGNLSSLDNGSNMFANTILDEQSLYNISTKIKDWGESPERTHEITLGTTVSNTDQYHNILTQKGWSVAWQKQTASTDVNSNDELLLKKTKVDSIEENQDLYTDGVNYYIVDWATKVSDSIRDEWTKFNTFDEGLNTWNLTKVN